MTANQAFERIDCFVDYQKTGELNHRGEQVELVTGVFASPLDDSAHVLLEITDGSRIIQLGGQRILDFAQIQTGESFTIDERPCFFLRPRQVQISCKAAVRDRAISLSPQVPVAAPQKPGRLRNVMPAGALVLMLVGAHASFIKGSNGGNMDNPFPDYPPLDTSADKQAAELPFAADTEKHLGRPQDQPADPASSPSIVKGSPPNARKRPEVTPTKWRKAGKALWNEYQEYLLEARFDPVGAKEKLQGLLDRVPRQTKLFHDITAELSP